MTVRLSDQPQPDWDTMPRLLQELCDGHPGYVIAAYAFDGFGHREWLCKHCWLKRWVEYRQARAAQAATTGGTP
jgi:hypothetical protein